MKKVSLVEMKEKQKGKIIQILGGDSFSHRMMNLNIYPGKEITKLSHFALKGPVTIKVGRSVLAIGHGAAIKIVVETDD